MRDQLHPKLSRSRLLATCVGVSLVGSLWASAAAAADITGHWGSQDGTFYDFVQTGADVLMTSPSSVRVFEGTIVGSAVEIASPAYPMLFPESYSLILALDESTLAGVRHTVSCVLSFCTSVDLPVTMSRTECDDGNQSSGDGCDFLSRVEPCHSCSGAPSVCVPVADSTPCEHPSQCVAGGTCSAGVCTGGVETASCVDIGGGWLRTSHRFANEETYTERDEIVQGEAGDLSFFAIPGGHLEITGTLDVSTRALQMDDIDTWPYCDGDKHLVAGTVAADGNSYGVVGWTGFLSTPHGCVGGEVFAELALRCADGSLEPSDGCMVDSCQRCSGDPLVCEPVPDATPCHSSDPCTVVATCEAGECVATIADQCPLCTACDGAGGCIVGPRNNCRESDDAESTMLAIKHDETGERSSLRWQWKDGGAVRPYDLGWPHLYSQVAVCVFDESTASPSLIFAGSVNDDLDPYSYGGSFFTGSAPGWKTYDDGSARFREKLGAADGITAIDLGTGAAGDSRVKLKGKGAGLLSSSTGFPTPALPLPLRAQVQIEGGACFEGRYGAAGVSRNADGVFRAKGTPQAPGLRRFDAARHRP